MKSRFMILQFLLGVVCLCASVSCGKLTDYVNGGDAIAFSGYAEGSGLTKLAYQGGNSYSEGDIEPLYWSVGDLVRIYCAQVDTVEFHKWAISNDKPVGKYYRCVADYVINEVNSSDRSKANIVLNSATTPIGLRWNANATKYHTFYGVYPAPGASGITYSYGIYTTQLYGNLKKEQNTLTGALSESDGNYTLAPDMKWMMMYGKGNKSYKRSNFPATGTVFMKFKPLTTAIQFTITNSVSKPLVIKRLMLISSSNQIYGKFRVKADTLASDGFPYAYFSSEADSTCKHVSLALNPEVTINQNKTFTFTFFLAPVADVDDLWFQITRGGDDDGATMKTRLGFTDGTGLKFPRCKKSFVKGVMVPEGVQWTIDYEPVLTEWVNDGGGDVTLN